MMRTENQTMMMSLATHDPAYAPRTTYPNGPTAKHAGPSHLTPIIGATALAVLLAAMGGVAVVRMQQAATSAALPRIEIPVSTYVSQVPTAVPRIEVPASTLASQVPTVASIEVPLSTVASQVPQAAR